MARLVELRGGGGMPTGSFGFEGDLRRAAWHVHDLHQLEYAFEGVVDVETEAARYRLPSRLAVWIPAGLPHVSTFREARTVSVFFDPVLVRETGRRARVLPVDPLLREMIVYAARWPVGRWSGDQTGDAFLEALAHLVVERLDEERPFALPNSADPLVRAVMGYTDAHLGSVTLAGVCRAVAVSERTLRRRFQAETGMTWRRYLLHSRLLRAITLLSGTDRTVLAIATEVGFDSPSAFTRAFAAHTGQTPAVFRRGRGRPR
ncbi:helix-turn-helix transcriptional regulator [Actinocorallia longicatena]